MAPAFTRPRSILPRSGEILLACVIACIGALSFATSSDASHRQALFFEAPHQLLDPSSRPETIETLQSLGVDAIRVEMPWYSVAPHPRRKREPSFNAKRPSSYDWGEYGALISEASRLKWKVLLTITAPAPRWATSNHRKPFVTRPKPRYFKQFLTAVARQFHSQVSLYAIWNEPNEYGYLRPQFDKRGQAVSPLIYRHLWEAGYHGLRASGMKRPRVLIGETAPGGFAEALTSRGLPKYAGVAPLAFLRGALCLDKSFHKSGRCKELPASGWAQHPYASNTKGPYYKPKSRESITIGTLGRLISALNRAGNEHAIRARMPVFLTEFGVMSKPNRFFGVSLSKQAEYDAIAERISWQHSRVAAFSQYLLRDDPLSASRAVSFQTGLEFATGKKKPLFFGFPLPLTVLRSHHHLSLWGLVRLARGATKVTILLQRKRKGSYRRLTTVKTNGRGYWHVNVRPGGRFWRVRWVSPEGVRYEGPPTKAYPDP